VASEKKITTLFLDIGGVLLTNGWDRHARRRAVEKFNLDYDEVDERHHLTFDTYEEGKLTLDQYLNRVVFFEERDFSKDDFKKFMYDQSKPIPEMINLIRKVSEQHGLRNVAISNEGRELTEHRIREFKLGDFIEAFISSCFVHFRKPDEDMFRMALDISQAVPEESIYVDDRPMFVEVARGMGINGICHTSLESTRDALSDMGLAVKDGQ
jgi:putative hydrolase of the HAD superfamily